MDITKLFPNLEISESAKILSGDLFFFFNIIAASDTAFKAAIILQHTEPKLTFETTEEFD